MKIVAPFLNWKFLFFEFMVFSIGFTCQIVMNWQKFDQYYYHLVDLEQTKYIE